MLLLSGQPAPRPLDRRAGRHQRRQELPERRRLVWRLFYDTIKGGDFRAREANVHRLAEVSQRIIDQCVAQGVPFAREYGGLLDNRSFGGAQVSRTFYARGQTGQQLLIGATRRWRRKSPRAA
jgi:succinate dehydrogenase/fumarate reductase flavoprotein subunit